MDDLTIKNYRATMLAKVVSMKKKILIVVVILLLLFCVEIFFLLKDNVNSISKKDNHTEIEETTIEKEKIEKEEKDSISTTSTTSADNSNMTSNSSSNSNTKNEETNSNKNYNSNNKSANDISKAEEKISSDQSITNIQEPQQSDPIPQYIGIPNPNDFYYSFHKGQIDDAYTTLEECYNKAFEVGFLDTVDIINETCYEVLDGQGTVLGIYMSVNCNSGNCERYKKMVGINTN